MTNKNAVSNILIVDDILENLNALMRILRKSKYNIEVAENGRKALNILDRFHPDLILLDIMMPEINGFELCQRIKSNDKYKDVPIIFITAQDNIKDKVKAFEVGGIDYIVKPFEPMEVLVRIKTQLKLKTALEENMKFQNELEDLLEQKTKELIRSERQAVISLMIEGIVHNLKSPLSIIYTSSEILREHAKQLINNLDLDKMNEFIKHVHTLSEISLEASKRLNKMITALLIKGFNDSLYNEELIDINTIIHDEIEFFNANHVFKHKIKKQVNLCENTLIIKAIPGEITQVIDNLIQNAIDAVANETEPEIIFNTDFDQEHIKFSICDNGCGIPKNIIDKVYNPFFSTKSQMKKENNCSISGTGLGLHSCLEIIKSYSGKIEISSREKEGTLVTIFIPVVYEKGIRAKID